MNDVDGFDEIFYGLEEEALGFPPDIDEPKKVQPAKMKDFKKEIKRNRFNLTEKESEIVCLLLCGGLFVILLSGGLIGYMLYYFSL